jgi:hypothetical protein
MENISVSDKQALDFIQARERAVAEARERIPEPDIAAWKDDISGAFAPAIPGGNHEHWLDYGEKFSLNEACTDADREQFVAAHGDGIGEGQAAAIQSRSSSMHYGNHIDRDIHTSMQMQPCSAESCVCVMTKN